MGIYVHRTGVRQPWLGFNLTLVLQVIIVLSCSSFFFGPWRAPPIYMDSSEQICYTLCKDASTYDLKSSTLPFLSTFVLYFFTFSLCCKFTFLISPFASSILAYFCIKCLSCLVFVFSRATFCSYKVRF